MELFNFFFYLLGPESSKPKICHPRVKRNVGNTPVFNCKWKWRFLTAVTSYFLTYWPGQHEASRFFQKRNHPESRRLGTPAGPPEEEKSDGGESRAIICISGYTDFCSVLSIWFKLVKLKLIVIILEANSDFSLEIVSLVEFLVLKLGT